MELIHFYNIADGITAGTTGRGNPSTEKPYSGFNVCHYVGDDADAVTECRQRLARTLRLPVEHILCPRQTHSSRPAVIDSFTDISMTKADTVVTRLSEVAIGVNTADCVPILLADTANHVIAAVHAGWRGLLAGVIENALAAMKAQGASLPCAKAVIAPSICRHCFEVGDDVARLFDDCGMAACIDRTQAKPHIDLPMAARMKLSEAGILPENISDSGICTRCQNRDFFSARALGVNSGRNFSFIIQHCSE